MKVVTIVASTCLALASIGSTHAAVAGPQMTAAPALQRRDIGGPIGDNYGGPIGEDDLELVELIGVPNSVTDGGDTTSAEEGAATTETSVSSTTTSARGPITLSNGNVIVGVSFSLAHDSYEPVSTSLSGMLVPASTTILSGNPLLATATNSVLSSTPSMVTSTSMASSTSAAAATTSAASSSPDGSLPSLSLNVAAAFASLSAALIAACLIL